MNEITSAASFTAYADSQKISALDCVVGLHCVVSEYDYENNQKRCTI